ncbi:MAG: prenyltransferase/squalene oxidase repeat-containing protein, partial [Pirellulaceae bacterium]
MTSDSSPAGPPVPWTGGPSKPAVTPEVGLRGRQGALKSALLAAYGGTAATEDAVKLGLAWLARQQRKDGEWSLRGTYSNGAISENQVAATAMALIAFAGAGHTHQQGDYQKTVERGVRFLVRLQDREGFFAADAPDRHQMYAQAQATIALGELYGMTGDQGLRPVVQRALDFAEQAQGQEGGWRYVPRDDSDTSVTGWFVMALMSGRMGGLSTDRRVLDRVHAFLDRVQSDNGSQYAYTSLSSNLPSYAMTAEGLLCREYLGWTKDDPRLIK